MKINKPWGHIKQYALNRNCSVKVINIKSHQETSLHYHNLRIDTWVILDGEIKVQVGDQEYEAGPGEEFYIPAGQNHRLVTGEQPARILEIAFGYSTEDDTERLADGHGRASTQTKANSKRS